MSFLASCHRNRLFMSIGLCAILIGGLLSSCGSEKSTTETTTSGQTGKDSTIAAAVPATIRDKGTLAVASDATYPPNEFIQDGKVVGMSPDLVTAVARVMGLKADVQNVTFDAIIPGLAAGKYDMGFSSFTDTKEREKVVDFVTYFVAGTSLYSKADGDVTAKTLADLCGQTVAVEKGTTQADDANAQSKKCTDQGKKAVTVLTFPDQNGANLAISSGRAAIGMADSPVAAYIVKQSKGQFKLDGAPFGTAPYGIALPKGNGMAEPTRDAMVKVIESGEYTAILKKWGTEQGAITADQVKINGATS